MLIGSLDMKRIIILLFTCAMLGTHHPIILVYSRILVAKQYLLAPVYIFVCEHHYSNSYEQIVMEFYGGIRGGTLKNRLNFGDDLDILRSVNEHPPLPQ